MEKFVFLVIFSKLEFFLNPQLLIYVCIQGYVNWRKISHIPLESFWDLDFLEYFEAFMSISQKSNNQLCQIIDQINQDI